MGQAFQPAKSVGQAFQPAALLPEPPVLEGLFRRRRLPHWDVPDGIYFVTTCLEGSIPAQGLVDLYRYRDELAVRAKPPNLSEAEWDLHRHKLLFACFDKLIDLQPAVKHLENPGAANIVRDAIYHFAGERYDLLAFVVMPSHLHWVFRPRNDWIDSLANVNDDRTPREMITQSINGYTAHQCNRLLGRRGAFWQGEAYDHVVRNDDELLRIIQYIENNPVKAGLVARAEDWIWSSAADRRTRSVVVGEYLLK